MNVTRFIEDVLIKEIYEVQQKHHYLSFLLISAGIEFLGACIDNEGFDDYNLSRKRFLNAIETLFPLEYKPHALHLYKNLRCGLAHIISLGSKIELTQLKESKATTHLGVADNEGLILVAETFYEDFKTACNKVIVMKQKGILTHPKLHTEFLKIPREK